MNYAEKGLCLSTVERAQPDLGQLEITIGAMRVRSKCSHGIAETACPLVRQNAIANIAKRLASRKCNRLSYYPGVYVFTDL